jgi:hypothetical protein
MAHMTKTLVFVAFERQCGSGQELQFVNYQFNDSPPNAVDAMRESTRFCHRLQLSKRWSRVLYFKHPKKSPEEGHYGAPQKTATSIEIAHIPTMDRIHKTGPKNYKK